MVFLSLQAGISVYTAVSLLALHGSVEHLQPIWEYLGRYEPLGLRDPLTQVALMYLALPLALIGPPTVMMGMSFPFLQRLVHQDLAGLGVRVGSL